MKKLLGLVFGVFLFVPFLASASTLTSTQVGAIISLLEAFGVSQTTITIVWNELSPTSEAVPVSVASSPVVSQPTESSVPTCTLTAVIVTDPLIAATLSWTSANATSATLVPLHSTPSVTWNITPVSAGQKTDIALPVFTERANGSLIRGSIPTSDWNGLATTSTEESDYKAVFTGPGGSTECDATIPAQQI